MIKWVSDFGNLGKILLGFIVLIVVMGSMTWAAFSQMKQITDETTHATLASAMAKFVLIDMLDAETGQRGFLLTGKKEYLEPFIAGSAMAEQDFGRLQELTEESEKPALAELGKQMRVKLDELRETVRLRQDVGFEAAEKVVLTDTGKNAMDVIRSIVKRFSDSRVNKIHEQEEAIKSLESTIEIAFLASMLLTNMLLALTIIVVLYRRSTVSVSRQIGYD